MRLISGKDKAMLLEKGDAMASTTPTANDLLSLFEKTISMEIRVEDAEVKNVTGLMEQFGFISKNSWASVKLTGHTVVEFWKGDLLKD